VEWLLSVARWHPNGGQVRPCEPERDDDGRAGDGAYAGSGDRTRARSWGRTRAAGFPGDGNARTAYGVRFGSA
ncbi:MAG: hypothetical protein V5A44_12345, partial [Haloarculaceae archaeon]